MSDNTRREFINNTIAAAGTLAAVQLIDSIGGAKVASAAEGLSSGGQKAPLLHQNDPGVAQPAWHELIEFLRGADMSFIDGRGGEFDEYEMAAGYRCLIHTLVSSINIFMEMDPNWPEFVQLDTRKAPFLGGNPDTRYDWAAIRGDRRYSIRGQRGDEAYLSFTSNRGDRGLWLQQRLDDNINHHKIKFDANGRFEIIASAEREGDNWLRISPDAAAIQARTYVLNRKRDVRATFTIEPLGPEPPPARARREEVAERLRFMTQLLREQYNGVIPRPAVAPNMINTVTRQPYHFALGADHNDYSTPDNVFVEGRFFLQPSEALVIEGVVVPCDYWGIQIWNPYLESPDHRYHKVSINKSEARLGPEGKFRVAIVTGEDPSVPGLDWITTAGWRQGTFYMRWLVSQTPPPNVSAKLVKIADLRG